MSGGIRITEEALADLEVIWEYIARDSPLSADRFISKLLDTCELISHTPHMGRTRDAPQKGLRSLPVGNHLIFYRVLHEAIEIVRVLHGGRDLEAIFSE